MGDVSCPVFLTRAGPQSGSWRGRYTCPGCSCWLLWLACAAFLPDLARKDSRSCPGYVHKYMTLAFFLRHGSNELDSSTSTARSIPVMLSAAKPLAAARNRPIAEFTLSEAHVLRVTLCDCSNGQALFFTLEPCLTLSSPFHHGISCPLP